MSQRLLLVLLLASKCFVAKACTNVLVTPGASADGNIMIAYNADSGNLFGSLYHYAASAGESSEGPKKKRQIYEWDTGKHLGEIPEAPVTYNVVGNTNEHGLVIGETTFGGVEILSPRNQPGAIVDYGSLIYVTLQRCKTAREAISTIADLMDTHGYASSGESFSIGDYYNHEVWIMEVIGRGNSGRKGAAWVARRVPDGYVTTHANQARITTFPRNDPDNCLYSDDVVDLAIKMGLYTRVKDQDPEDLKFSFSDVYDPLTFMGARYGEARVWSIFSIIAKDEEHFQKKYERYATGTDLSTRMPLWIEPKEKLTLFDIISIMANHHEGSVLSSSSDVGAGSHGVPYRPRPMVWEFEKKQYVNERTVATQQTGWNFIAQIRKSMPRELSSILWFGVDDSSLSPRFPVYGSSQSISSAYYGKGPQDGVASPVMTFDLTKAFWVQNMVSNFAYSRWDDIYPIVRKKIEEITYGFLEDLKLVDEKAESLYTANGADSAVAYVTNHGVSAGDEMHKVWMDFYGELFVRFRDFFDITSNAEDPGCRCNVREEGFTDAWKSRIVKEAGAKYSVLHGKQRNDVNDNSDSHNGKPGIRSSPLSGPQVITSNFELPHVVATNKLELM